MADNYIIKKFVQDEVRLTLYRARGKESGRLDRLIRFRIDRRLKSGGWESLSGGNQRVERLNSHWTGYMVNLLIVARTWMKKNCVEIPYYGKYAFRVK